MELLEIRSARDLSGHLPETRRTVAHSYMVSCRQFMFVLGKRRMPNTMQGPAAGQDATFGFMTLAADQIWMTEPEITQIVGAIQSAHSPVSLA